MAYFDFHQQLIISQLNNLYYYIDKVHLEHPDAFEDEEAYKNRWKWALISWAACPDSHFVYDRLKEEGKLDLEVNGEVKKTLWGLSRKKLSNDTKTKNWVQIYKKLPEGKQKNDYKSLLDTELSKIYKSMILRYILALKAHNEGIKIEMQDEDGIKIQQLTIVASE